MSTPRRRGSVDGRLYDYPFTGEYGYSRPVLDSIVDIAATAGQADASTTQRQLVSASPSPAETGTWRLARGDSVAWRNQANNADLQLGPPGVSPDGLAFVLAYLRGVPCSVAPISTQGALTATVNQIPSSTYPPGAATKLVLPFEALDNANFNSAGTFTVPLAGDYFLLAEVRVTSNSAVWAVGVHVNGTERGVNYRNVTAGTVRNCVGISALLHLAVNDVVTLRVTQNAGTPQSVDYVSTSGVMFLLPGTATP